MKLCFLAFLLITTGSTLFAQTNIDTAAIKNELAAIRERDQKTRTGGDSAQFMTYIDSCNLVLVEALINEYGWLGKNFVCTGELYRMACYSTCRLRHAGKIFPLNGKISG
jgi:hypothetical protein